MTVDPLPSEPEFGAYSAAAAEVPDLHLLLDLAESGVALLKTAAPLVNSTERRPSSRKLHHIFWDTAEYRLGRAGQALAVETVGRRRAQLLHDIRRAPTGGRIGRQHRTVLEGEGLDLTRLAFMPGADPEHVIRLASETLLPVFAIDFTRTVWPVSWGETKLTVALEVGTIEAAAGRAPLRQVDVGLIAGTPEGLYDFVQHLQRTVPIRLAAHDPAQHGYKLIAEDDWWPENGAGTATLDPAMSVRQGILVIGRAATAAVRAEIHRLSEGLEPERVHQARVAIRRLRSVLSVFCEVLPSTSRKTLSRGLSALSNKLGQAREWDVFLANTLKPMTEAVGEEASLNGLRLTAVSLRNHAAEEALIALEAPAFLRLSFRLGSWFDAGIWPEAPSQEVALLLDKPLKDFAGNLLKKRHKKLLSAAAAANDPHPAQLHALRIEAKKLRYTAEFVGSLFPSKAIKRYISALKDIQGILGTVNDAVVARALISRLPLNDRSDGARVAGLITGWTAAEVGSERKRFDEAWTTFIETKRFWK
jgi:triphosphatase